LHLQAEGDVSTYGKVREEGIVLEHHSEPAAFGWRSHDALTVELNITHIGRQQASNAIKGGSLSTSRGAEEAYEFAPSHIQVEVLQGSVIRKPLCQSADPQSLDPRFRQD